MQETKHSHASNDGRIGRRFDGQQGGAACDVPDSVHSRRSRLDRARSLLHETESRLASVADVHDEQVQPVRRHPISVQQGRQAQQGENGQEVATHCVQANEIALLRRFEQGGVHEIAASGIAAEGIDARSSQDASWEVVPHACLIFLAHRLLTSGRSEEEQIEASRERESCIDRVASSNCVAWIGNRVHPHPRSLQMVPCLRSNRLPSSKLRLLPAVAPLASRSIFVCDSERSFAPVRHGHLSRNAFASNGRFRSGTVKRLQMDARACNRLWCAEQAIRMGAVRMVIVDGEGFSPLAWRRLQLAVDASALTGQENKPCVLVVTSSPDGRQSSGCAATARWLASVAAPADLSADLSVDLAFAWRLRLMSARQFGLHSARSVRVADTDECTPVHDRTAVPDHGCIEIAMPRSAAGERADFGWALVSARAARRGAENHPGIHAHSRGHDAVEHESGVCGVLATFVMGDSKDAPGLEPESGLQMSCTNEGAQPWHARSA